MLGGVCCLSYLLGGDPHVLVGGKDRLMGVRFLGEFRPRGGPGLGASPPGIAAVSSRTKALENAKKRRKSSAKHLVTIVFAFYAW
jgi:hypothetical protein